MEFLVKFDVNIPEGTPEADVEEREIAEADAAAGLAREGRLVRLWRLAAEPEDGRAVGLYRADSEAHLNAVLASLPLDGWMEVTVTPLEPHPNDPAGRRTGLFKLPDPSLTPVYRLDATLGEPLDLGDTMQGHRRIVPLTGGTFTGPEISGTLVPSGSADWQTILADGTALGDIRYTLRTARGDLLDVRSRAVRHGPAEVLARLARGENVDPGEYTFRAGTRIETAAPGLDWLNKGVFISAGARRRGAVIYETYLAR